MRQRKGWTYEQNGQWYARFDYKTPDMPRKKTVRRIAKPNTEKAADDLLRRLLLELDESGPQSVTPQVRTFRQLIDYYTETYVLPAWYVDGKKVGGLRSHNKVKSFLKPIANYFGDVHLPAVTYSHLEKYRSQRL